MLWLLVFIVLVLVSLITRQCKDNGVIELSRKLKFRFQAWPLIGHAYLFLGTGIGRMDGIMKVGREALQHGGITGAWLGPRYYVVAADPADLEVILKAALEKDDVLRFMKNVTGNGSIFAPVAIWRPRRKILAPTFSLKNLNNFVEVFSRHSHIMVKQMMKDVDKETLPRRDGAQCGQALSVWKYLNAYALDSICENALNVNLNSQQSFDIPFSKSFVKVSNYLSQRMTQPWLHSDLVYNLTSYYRDFTKNKIFLWNFIDEAVKSCRKFMENTKEREKSYKDNKTFMELMIESSGSDRGYNDLELREEALVIALAASDSSAVAACFVISMMARFPDIQEKVVEELQAVIGDSDKPVTADDLTRLRYLEVVVKETLRLYPPVPISLRKIEKDLELPSGITLVKGCGVLAHFWATHRNPLYWGDDAEQFRPERFLEAPLKHPAAFIPFSHGPRSCIGYQYAMMSIKTVLATFLYNYRVLSPEDDQTDSTNNNHKPIRLSFEIMMKDADGFKVRLEKRM